MIINDGLDQFYSFGGEGELTCPVGWIPVWVQGTGEGNLVRPEFKPAGAAQIRNGAGAAAIHSRFATIDGALVRSFSVLVGDKLRAGAWMLKTEDGLGHSMRVGIDPTGGTQHTSDRILWSEWYSATAPDYQVNGWRQRTVSAVAESNIATVFLQSRVDYKAEGTNAHFDDVTFEIESVAPPDPEPEPPPQGQLSVQLIVNGQTVYKQAWAASILPVGDTLLARVVRGLMRHLGG